MRKQTRPPEPDEFKENSHDWNEKWAAKCEAAAAEGKRAAFAWNSIGGRTAREIALDALHDLNQKHCSFCDAFPLEGSSTTPIEHFKPKGVSAFYREAFSWSNLYYCCECCQSAKRELWDDKLLRPDDPAYEFLRYFEFDFGSGQIKPSSAATPDDQAKAAVTISIYKLDHGLRRTRRKLELRKWTRTAVREIDLWGYRDFLELNEVSTSQATP